MNIKKGVIDTIAIAWGFTFALFAFTFAVTLGGLIPLAAVLVTDDCQFGWLATLFYAISWGAVFAYTSGACDSAIVCKCKLFFTGLLEGCGLIQEKIDNE